MTQLRKMIGTGLTILLLCVFCVSARCEVLCSFPAAATCECPGTSRANVGMPEMTGMSHRLAVAPVSAGSDRAKASGILSRAACRHSVSVPDAEANAPASAHTWAQVSRVGESTLRVGLQCHASGVCFANAPPNLPMTPLLQASALRI